MGLEVPMMVVSEIALKTRMSMVVMMEVKVVVESGVDIFMALVTVLEVEMVEMMAEVMEVSEVVVMLVDVVGR